MEAETSRAACYDGDFAFEGEEGLEVLELNVCGRHAVECDAMSFVRLCYGAKNDVVSGKSRCEERKGALEIGMI